MLREERKWNHTKYLIKSEKTSKEWDSKAKENSPNGTKDKNLVAQNSLVIIALRELMRQEDDKFKARLGFTKTKHFPLKESKYQLQLINSHKYGDIIVTTVYQYSFE